MSYPRRFVLGSLILSGLAAGSCEGCGEEYYCDDTGCYWCDSYGCRPVDEPPRPRCTHGDWECPPDQPFCTEDGHCVAQCSEDSDCPLGLRCLEGLCLPPDTYERPGMRPGYCYDDVACREGEYCAPSRCCLPVGGNRCCADIDCPTGMVCNQQLNECHAGFWDAVPIEPDVPAGETEGPPLPGPQCRSNADCPAHYLCIDGVCKLPCTSDAQCGTGCLCIDGFCTLPDQAN